MPEPGMFDGLDEGAINPDPKKCNVCAQEKCPAEFYAGKKTCKACCREARKERYRDQASAADPVVSGPSADHASDSPPQASQATSKDQVADGFMDIVNAVSILLKIDRRLRPQVYEKPQAEC